MEHDLSGRRALVTGGTRGIGAATAALLRDRGAEVVVAARSAPTADADAGWFVPADLSRPGAGAELAATVLDRWGGLDVLVDNAGGQSLHERVEDFTAEDWQRDLQLNLLAAVELDRALLPALTAARGAVVHVSSTVARMPEPAVVAYAAAKAGLAVYSKALARQVGPAGVRVNVVLPGFTATEMFLDRFAGSAAVEGTTYDDVVRTMTTQAGVALRRAAAPAEVAAVIAFLVSPASSYVTGAQIMVDGGILPTVF